MRRVLVGVDGSRAGATALAWAAALAARLDAELVVAHVYAADPADQSSWDEAHERTRRRLDEWCLPARAAEITVEEVVLDGEVGPALLAAAHERDVDLIAMSRRGAGGFDGLLVGSAADYVAHHARGPIAVLPPDVPPSPPSHVLIGLDGSDAAAAAVRWFAPVAAAIGARVTAAYVPPIPEIVTNPTKRQREQAEQALDAWTAPLRDAGVVTESRVLVDRHPADALISLAEAEGVDAVAIGTRSVGGLRRIRLGGVTMQLLHHCAQPVIAVPPVG